MKHIASNVRILRESKNWTQEKLAKEALVTERTIQRVERGEAVNEETLAGLAATFNVPRALLEIDTELAMKQMAAEVEALKKDHVEVELRRVRHGLELAGIMDTGMYLPHCDSTAGDVRDSAAEFESWMHDLGDIWSDYGPAERREVEKHLGDWVQRFAALGCRLYAAAIPYSLDTNSVHGPLRTSLLITHVTQKEDAEVIYRLVPKKVDGLRG